MMTTAPQRTEAERWRRTSLPRGVNSCVGLARVGAGMPYHNSAPPTSGALGPPSMRRREAFADGLGRLSSSAGSPLCNLGMSETSLPLARGDADAA
jgi:hypothetical protein